MWTVSRCIWRCIFNCKRLFFFLFPVGDCWLCVLDPFRGCGSVRPETSALVPVQGRSHQQPWQQRLHHAQQALHVQQRWCKHVLACFLEQACSWFISRVCVQILQWISKLCHETVSSTDSHIPFVSFHQILHLSEDKWETIHSVVHRSNAIRQSIKHTGYPQGRELMFTYMHSVHSHSVPEWNSWSRRESKTLFCLSQRHSTGGPRPNA